MSRQARLGVDQALELLDDSDVEGDWSESEEEDGDDSYLPDALEIAQLEAGDDEQLNDSDIQPAEITSDTEVQNDTENLDGDKQDNTESDNQSQTCDSGTDSHPQDASHSSSSTTTIAPFTPPPFMAQSQPGPYHTLPGTASVEEFFLLICGENFFQTLAEQCNLYARQQPPGSSYNWVDTTESEMKLFLGIHLAMGVHKLPCVEDYWSQHPLLGAPGISHGMPIRRFKALQSCLHLNDNTTAKKRGEPGYDKLHKIRPVMESIRENSQRYYSLHREVSVDEAMVGYKGRSSMKQYCPMKPTKRGYKVWALSDAHTGYMYNFTVYCGATRGVTEHGLGASVVQTMTEPVLEKSHYVFFDNFFSTVPLAKYLQKKNTYCVSTARVDRVDWPIALKQKKTLNRRLKRGDYRSVIVSPGVQCFAWKDKKLYRSLTPSAIHPAWQQWSERRRMAQRSVCPAHNPCSCTTSTWGE